MLCKLLQTFFDGSKCEYSIEIVLIDILIFSAILLPSVGFRKCAVTPLNKWLHYYQQT